MKVLNTISFSCFQYKTPENHGNRFDVGDIVFREDSEEVGVVLQVFNHDELRTDMFGNHNAHLMNLATKEQISEHRPKLLNYLMPKSKKQLKRLESLFPNNTPKNIRCYDNGESGDRYTCVFTGRYTHKTGGEYWYLGMSDDPFHPQGIGQSGTSPTQIDRPKYSHLGKKVSFEELPFKVKQYVIDTYLYLWGFTDEYGQTVD